MYFACIIIVITANKFKKVYYIVNYKFIYFLLVTKFYINKILRLHNKDIVCMYFLHDTIIRIRIKNINTIFLYLLYLNIIFNKNL